jgi:hypothetical protein
VAPAMDDSNPVFFTVTTHPLPAGWLDQDIGQVGMTGSASYASGVFTIQGAGQGIYSGSTSDSFHFVYQSLPGDGTIVARVVSLTGGSYMPCPRSFSAHRPARTFSGTEARHLHRRRTS